MTSVILAGAGKKSFGLHRSVWHRVPGLAIFSILILVLLLTGDIQTVDLRSLGLVGLGFVAVLESIYRRGNFVVIHPEHVDTSRLSWGMKMRKREKHRIRYKDVTRVRVDGPQLDIGFRLNRSVLKRVGIEEWSAVVTMRSEADALEAQEAIELGRARAIERVAL